MNNITDTSVVTVSPVFEFIKKIHSKIDHLKDVLKTVSQSLPERAELLAPSQPTELLGELNQIDIKLEQILDTIVI